MEHYPMVRSKLSRLRQNHRITDHYDQPSPERGHPSSNFPAFEPSARQSQYHSLDIYGNSERNSRPVRPTTIQTPTPNRAHGICVEDRTQA